jgi:hypothetical protein
VVNALSALTMRGPDPDGYINKFEVLCLDVQQCNKDKMRRFRLGSCFRARAKQHARAT